MLRRMTRILIVCIVAVCGIVPTGIARIVTVRFTAEITEVTLYTERGEPGDDVRFVVESLQVGDSIEGVYAYDTSAPDLSDYGWSGTYQFDARPCGITVSTNRFVFKTDPEAAAITIETANDLKPFVDSLPHDEFVISSDANLMKPAMADIQCAGITLTLGALGGSDPLSDDSLPLSAPVLEDWAIRALELSGGPGGSGMFHMTVTSAELLPDPAWVLHVDAAAAPGGDGLSWATAYASLQDAIADTATVGNTEIRVAQGVYKPDQGAGRTPGDRLASFELISSLALKGGYAGLGAPDPNARDIALYETILSGDLAGNDVEVSDPCDLEDEPSRAENSYHVVYMEAADDTTSLEGVTVTGGYAWMTGGPGRDAPSERYNGGGLRCVMSEDPTIAKCTFRGNFARTGGGMLSSSNAKVIGCTFMMNAASAIGGEGGGMRSGGNPIIEKCSFIGNRAADGGGMSNLHADSTLSNCSFFDNSAIGGGGGAWVSGGKAVFSNCVFKRNSAQGGGAVRISVDDDSSLVNCLFENNQAEEKGGAIENHVSRNLSLENCTFVQNSSLRGNAFFHDERSRNTVLNSCILWGASPEIWAEELATITVSYCNLHGGWDGVGNIDADPLFAAPNNGDYHLKSQAGRWDPVGETWVQDDVTSPCIDAGDPNSPIGYKPFPNGGIVNMGAYGGTAEASKSYFGQPLCETIIAGDINGDCRVDWEDLAILSSHWLQEGHQ